jgi:hypothetical protein
MDRARLAALASGEPAPEIVTAGRSRLLYPSHWQSPYLKGNRYADLFERCTIEWLTRFGLIATPDDAQTIKEFECGLYGGLSSPGSSLRDGLLITQFVSLWLFFDDRVIEDSSAWSLDDLVSSMVKPDLVDSSNGFLNAWKDLCERLRRTQSEGWMARLGASLRAWIENAQLESGTHASISRPDHCPPSTECWTSAQSAACTQRST